MDATPADQAAEEVREGASEFVLAQLTQANLRLTEIEAELRRTRRERDAMARNVRALEETFSDATTPEPGYLRSEAGRIASLIPRLSVTQRRDMWLTHLAQLNVSGPLQWLYPHAGGGDPLTLMVVGSGGFGDVLCLTPVVRALRRLFPGSRVFVVHQHPGVELLNDCPYVEGVQHCYPDTVERFLAGASALDVFDLIVDVRYVVTYTAPPLSRIPQPFLIAAHARSAGWQPYVAMNWPHINNALAREAARLGMAQLDLTGYTANLDVSRDSPLELAAVRPGALTRRAPEEIDAAWRRLIGRPYVTIHHGADRNMAGAGGVQTKNLPLASLERVVADLRAADVEVVQLGENEETRIPGDLVDLRGALAFRETAYVIAHACAHVDSEGGLVHAARAMFTPSVVAFGPTSVPFFGYPGNVNVAPPLCGDCWWTSRDWSRRCVRGLAAPECMESHDSRNLVEAALGFAKARRLLVAAGEKAPEGAEPARSAPKSALGAAVALWTKKPRASLPEIVFPPNLARGPAPTLAEQIAAVTQPGAQGLVVFETLAEVRAFADGAFEGAQIAVPAEIFREAEAAFASEFLVRPLVRGRLAIETDALDWLILAGLRKLDSALFDLLMTAARCVKTGGEVRARLRGEGGGEEAGVRRLVEEIVGLDAQRLGDGAGVDLVALGRSAARMLRADGSFELIFTPQRVARAPELPAGADLEA